MISRQSVLIVEDDDELRRLYRHTLAMAGFDVYEARGGFEALRRLDTTPPDIIVLDLMLPGVDGFAVRRELAAQAHTRDIPIVIVTGATAGLDDLEVDCLLKKPVAAEELVLTVQRCLALGARKGQTHDLG
jgi:DNA-binding response OmpR family regulator